MKVDPSADPKEISGRPGHPNNYSDEELLKFIPESGITKTDWKKAADAETGIGKSTFYRRAEELEKRGLVKQDLDTGLVKKSDFHSMFAQIKNAKRSIGGRPFNGN